MVKVYVSSPITQSDQEENVLKAMVAADRLIDAGYCPVVPHYSCYQHELTPHYSCYQHDLTPRPYETWVKLDFALLEVCDAVLRLDGVSPGADREEALARRSGIPVFRDMEALNAVFHA